MKRLFITIACALLTAPAFAQQYTYQIDKGPWDLYNGTKKVSTHEAENVCVSTGAAMGMTKYSCRSITRVAKVAVSSSSSSVASSVSSSAGSASSDSSSSSASSESSSSQSSAASSSSSSVALSVRVQDGKLVDAQGNTLQLRGANTSALEFVAIQGWSAADPWGGQFPNWDAMKAWKMNAVRIPLNEASWAGKDCVDPQNGLTRNADPGKNYRATVKAAVDALTARGMYVILDLHIASAGNYCPNTQFQGAAANAENSLTFWTSLANAYKSYPNVLFELYNEPFVSQEVHFNWFSKAGNAITYDKFQDVSWECLMKGTGGCLFDGFQSTKYTWEIASMQAMLDTVRATGATNVVLVGAMMYDQQFDGWLKYRPIDPLNQTAAAWHPYPQGNSQPYNSATTYAQIKAIIAAGYPVIITEFGDNCYDGLTAAPTVTNVLNFSDQNGVSVVGWGWNTWYGGGSYCEFVLIKDKAGTPTDGYGKVFRDWLLSK